MNVDPDWTNQVLGTALMDRAKVERPEALDLLDGEPGTSDIVVSGQVSDLIYLGDVEQYCVALEDGTRFKVVEYNPLKQKAEIGNRVRLRFSQDAVVILRDFGEAEC